MLAYFVAALSKSKLSTSRPSLEILIKQSSVLDISLLLASVLMRFIAKNPRSHVDTGTIIPMFASFASCGNIKETDGLTSDCIISVAFSFAS